MREAMLFGTPPSGPEPLCYKRLDVIRRCHTKKAGGDYPPPAFDSGRVATPTVGGNADAVDFEQARPRDVHGHGLLEVQQDSVSCEATQDDPNLSPAPVDRANRNSARCPEVG